MNTKYILNNMNIKIYFGQHEYKHSGLWKKYIYDDMNTKYIFEQHEYKIFRRVTLCLYFEQHEYKINFIHRDIFDDIKI